MLQHPSPLGIWTCESWLIQIPSLWGKNCVQMHQPISCKKAKSVAITFYIDHALKLRPCFWRLFGNENKIFTFKHLHIKRYNNCIPLDVLDSSGVNPYLPQDFVKTQQLQILLHNTQPWTVLQGKCLWSEKVFYAFKLLKKCVAFSWHIRSLYLK